LQWEIQNLVIKTRQSSKLGDNFVQDFAFNAVQLIVFEHPAVQDFVNIDR
jgi:hypothetical protein